jgi:hypothetical protein
MGAGGVDGRGAGAGADVDSLAMLGAAQAELARTIADAASCPMKSRRGVERSDGVVTVSGVEKEGAFEWPNEPLRMACDLARIAPRG